MSEWMNRWMDRWTNEQMNGEKAKKLFLIVESQFINVGKPKPLVIKWSISFTAFEPCPSFLKQLQSQKVKGVPYYS